MVPRFSLKSNRRWTIILHLSNSYFRLNGNIERCFYEAFCFLARRIPRVLWKTSVRLITTRAAVEINTPA